MKIIQKISPPDYADNMTFSPCGHYIACCNSVYDIEIWIYDRKGKLLTTIIPPDEATSGVSYPVLIWQDDYLILNGYIRLFVWKMGKNPTEYEFLHQFDLHKKTSVRSVQYLNHQLYLALNHSYFKLDDPALKEFTLTNFQVLDLQTGKIAEQELYYKPEIIHDKIELNIDLESALISKFNERILVSSEFMGEDNPNKWQTFLTINDKKYLLKNGTSYKSKICENPNTGDLMILLEDYHCFYYDRNLDELINKTQPDIKYIALSAYQNSFVLMIFDNKEEQGLIWNVAMDKKYPSKKQIGNCIATYGDDVLLTIGEQMAIVNLSN